MFSQKQPVLVEHTLRFGGVKHYLILLVKSIQDMGGSIFKHDGILGGFFPGFMRDPYRVTLELLRDPNVIILTS